MTAKLAALAGVGAVPCNFPKSGAVTAGIGADGTAAPWNQSAVAVPALTPELSRLHRAARQAFRGESAEAVATAGVRLVSLAAGPRAARSLASWLGIRRKSALAAAAAGAPLLLCT